MHSQHGFPCIDMYDAEKSQQTLRRGADAGAHASFAAARRVSRLTHRARFTARMQAGPITVIDLEHGDAAIVHHRNGAADTLGREHQTGLAGSFRSRNPHCVGSCPAYAPLPTLQDAARDKPAKLSLALLRAASSTVGQGRRLSGHALP